MISSTSLRVLALSSACLLPHLAGCGSEKSKEKQAEEFYAEKLRPSEQAACNEQKKVFDPSESGTGACTAIPLATYACTRDEIKKAFGATSGADAAMVKIDGIIAEGFEFHQCGRGAIPATATEPTGFPNGIYINFIKKTRTSDQAGLQFRVVAYSIEAAGATLIDTK